MSITEQKILILHTVNSIINYFGFSIGKESLIRFMKGHRLRVIKTFGLYIIPTYGSLLQNKEDLSEIINQLIEEEFLT